jgi:nitroreductase
VDDAATALLNLMGTTRAIRRYRSEPIPDDDLATIMWAATRAPSGTNRQLYRFLVLRDGPKAGQAKALLGDSFRSGWLAKQRDEGFGTPGPEDMSPRARMERSMQQFVDRFESTPVVVLACLKRHRAANPSEGASVFPAVQNLLLAARALGYGGVITMWHHEVEAELRQLLGIPDDVALSACIPLGRPEGGGHGPLKRRPMTETVFDDTWDRPAEWAHPPSW